MKHIEKRPPIADFVDFVQNEHPTNWDDIHHSKRHPDLYQDCRLEILLSEQNGLGAYTERPLLDAPDLHIDHYRKKGMNWPNNVTFDWNNLVVENRATEYGACYKDKNTNNMDDYQRLLNPMVDYPEIMMTYLPNGKIVPVSGLGEVELDKVNFTIERFNLNYELLRVERETILKIVVENYSQLTDDEIRQALTDNGYPTMVEWVLKARHC